MAFAAINSSRDPSTLPVVGQAAPAVNYALIDSAFAADSSLRKRVYDAIGVSPQHGALFQDIAQYTSSLQSQLQQQQQQHHQYQTTQTAAIPDQEPAIKKRKLETDQNIADSLPSVQDLKADSPLQFFMQDVSFAVPQRKKLTLEMTAAGSHGYLRARNQTSKGVEFGIPIKDIQHILCLPVPEKAQRQFNFCIIPKYGDGVTPVPDNASIPDQMVWTIPDGPAKAAYTGNGQRVEGGDEGGESLLRRWLNEGIGHTKVIRPDEREFVSATPEAHRKGEKAYHVKAHRGVKTKPLLFFSFENIESVSYTSVLQRTFNLNITTRVDANEDTQEFEFSMIDQADYAGIDAYIKAHELQDASLAEARRAKYNVNTGKGADKTNGTGATTEGGGEEEEESELQKAQRELEDQEDEEEEDYDPGSDGDSDGSGSSSEEDDDDDDQEGDEDGDVEDLVKKELGSEAEDDL